MSNEALHWEMERHRIERSLLSSTCFALEAEAEETLTKNQQIVADLVDALQVVSQLEAESNAVQAKLAQQAAAHRNQLHSLRQSAA